MQLAGSKMMVTCMRVVAAEMKRYILERNVIGLTDIIKHEKMEGS